MVVIVTEKCSTVQFTISSVIARPSISNAVNSANSAFDQNEIGKDSIFGFHDWLDWIDFCDSSIFGHIEFDLKLASHI